MLKEKRPLIVIFASLVIVTVIGILRPHPIDWTATFAPGDKIPFGTYILYNSLGQLFDTSQVSSSSKPTYLLLHKKKFKNTSLIFVQEEFRPERTDVNELLAFVNKGNSVFISASYFGSAFTDTLNLTEKPMINFKHLLAGTKSDTSSQHRFNFTNPALKTDTGYFLDRASLGSYFDLTDTSFVHPADSAYSHISSATVLGTQANNFPVFIQLKFGKGNIYLHNYPYAFTNYYMVKPGVSTYAAHCLSYLPNQSIIWSDYYKETENQSRGSFLQFILDQESLRWAYYTAVFSLLLFIVFNIKRKQRVIPIVEPYRNASVEFTQTIGALYFNQSNHKDIALKKISYFLEFLRTRYNLDTSEINPDFVRRLSLKSGIDTERVETLIRIFSGVQQKRWLSDIELIDLTNMIDHFKKDCQ